jgi:hypothetical protein
MAQASVKGGGWKAPVMLIEFKDGTQKEFSVWTVSVASHANLFFSGGLMDTATQDQRSSTQQWVTAINMLIVMQTK